MCAVSSAMSLHTCGSIYESSFVTIMLARTYMHTVSWYVCDRECALVQAVCVCAYRPIAAAGHHLWPNPPSGLLWLQIVPLGSQGLRLRMTEMTRHRQSPHRLDGSLCYVCLMNHHNFIL